MNTLQTVTPEMDEPEASHIPAHSLDETDAPEPAALEASNDTDTPDFLPPKFWDADAGEVRIEELARSYIALEKRLGAAGGDTVPEDPNGYRIEPAMEGMTPDPEVNVRLIEAGFTQAQAQLVYDLAAEKLAPLVRDLASETVQGEHRRRLADHFGGHDRWETAAEQIQSWGQTNLPAPVLEALSQSYDGVLTLHRMMRDGEPELVSGAAPAASGRSESQLRRMMEDPRYWRDHDPAFTAQVQKGFEDLYPDEG